MKAISRARGLVLWAAIAVLSACQTSSYTTTSNDPISEVLCTSVTTGKTYSLYGTECLKDDNLISNTGPGSPTAQTKTVPTVVDTTSFEAAIATLKGMKHASDHLVREVITYAVAAGPSSKEYKALARSLAFMSLSRRQLDSIAAPHFPDAVRRIVADRVVKILLVVQPDDRLLREDVAAKLRDVSPNIELVSGKADITVTLRPLQWHERREPDRVQPIMYAQHQVDILAAALLMPRNASYAYDVTAGAASLDFAVEVKASGRGVVEIDKLVRDTARREWRVCSNARVQNVFGGVSPADFVANDHMRQICGGNTQPASAKELRDGAIQRIVNVIRGIEPISAAIAKG